MQIRSQTDATDLNQYLVDINQTCDGLFTAGYQDLTTGYSSSNFVRFIFRNIGEIQICRYEYHIKIVK